MRARGALRRSVVPSLSDRLRANRWTISNIRPGSSRWSVTGSADESGSRSRRWTCRWMTRMRSWFGPRRGESAIKRAGMLAGRRGAHHRSQQHPLILRPAHTERVHGLREAGLREVLERRRAEEERPDLHSKPSPANSITRRQNRRRSCGSSLVSTSSLSFRRFLSGSLALAFVIHTCRAHGATFPTTLTTTALDRSSSGWFAASACTATAEGHQTTRSSSSISRTAPHPAA